MAPLTIMLGKTLTSGVNKPGFLAVLRPAFFLVLCLVLFILLFDYHPFGS